MRGPGALILWGIGVFQLCLTIAAFALLYRLNLTAPEVILPSGKDALFWKNLALFGFSGSLLYFSRKTYSYLISEKLLRSEAEIKRKEEAYEYDVPSRTKALRSGYYLYLTTRPFSGLLVGPLMGFIILGGFTTLSKESDVKNLQLSTAGVFLSYILAFLGGYTSSDFFDRISRAGSRLSKKIGEQIG